MFKILHHTHQYPSEIFNIFESRRLCLLTLFDEQTTALRSSIASDVCLVLLNVMHLSMVGWVADWLSHD